jgi:hypothetical protein
MSIKYGTPEAVALLSDYLFQASQQKRTSINKMSAPFPKGAGMKEGRMQTSNHYPVVEAMDLMKGAGDEIKFNLRGPVFGKPFKGNENFEGKGLKMPWDQAALKLNFSAFPVYAGSKMDQQRTTHDLYTSARESAVDWVERFNNEASLVHLYGDRGFEMSGNWSVPLMSDPDFQAIMDNDVVCPTYNRHYMVNGDYIEPITAAASEISIATTDDMTLRTIEAIVTKNNESTYPVIGCKFDGDDMGVENPVGILLVSDRVYDQIKNSGNISTYEAQAVSRARMPGQHPIFQGAPMIWKNCLVIVQPKPIRFYSGNPLRHATSVTDATPVATDLVPAAFGTSYASDRSIFIGAMALGKVIGGHDASKYGVHKKLAGYMWSEEWLNHKTKLEVAAMMMQSYGKFRFDMTWGNQVQPTDYGVMAIDSVVPLY